MPRSRTVEPSPAAARTPRRPGPAPRRLAGAALALLLLACGQPSPESALAGLQERLDRGEVAGLADRADALRARAQAARAPESLAWRLEKLALLADAQVPRAEAVRSRLTRLATAGERRADVALSAQLAQRLSRAGDHAGALAVLDDAVGRWPASAEALAPAFTELERAMTASGDDAALAALHQLPYLR